MNDNNHRTRIDRFKGAEALSLGRENDWSLAMETSRRLMVNFFPHHLPSDGSIQPTDKLFHSPRGYRNLFCCDTIDIVLKRQSGEVKK